MSSPLPGGKRVATRPAVASLGLLAVGVLLASHLRGTDAPRAFPAGGVLPVSQLQTKLSRAPAAWLGRVVRVHGVAVGCRAGCVLLPAGHPTFGLVDQPTSDWIGDLGHALPLRVPIALGPQTYTMHDTWDGWRWVPLIGLIVPAPQTAMGIPPDVAPLGTATYTVRLVNQSPCTFYNLSSPCVVAILLKKAEGPRDGR